MIVTSSMRRRQKYSAKGSERRDGRCVAQAPTLQSSLDSQATVTDVTSKNRHVSAAALLQGEGFECIVCGHEHGDVRRWCRESGKQCFLLGEEVLPNDDWTDPESDRVQRGAGGPEVKTTNKKRFCKGFATTSIEDSTTAGHKGREQWPWKRRWCARRWTECEHDHKQNKKC